MALFRENRQNCIPGMASRRSIHGKTAYSITVGMIDGKQWIIAAID
jgi:hypothetical protein